MAERKTVLVIDDDNAIRDLVRAIIETNHNVIEAERVDNGFQIAKNQKPDLIITDFHTPGNMNGLQLIAEIKDIPIILLSGNINIPTQAIDLGAKFAFGKPFRIHDLIKASSSILD